MRSHLSDSGHFDWHGDAAPPTPGAATPASTDSGADGAAGAGWGADCQFTLTWQAGRRIGAGAFAEVNLGEGGATLCVGGVGGGVIIILIVATI